MPASDASKAIADVRKRPGMTRCRRRPKIDPLAAGEFCRAGVRIHVPPTPGTLHGCDTAVDTCAAADHKAVEAQPAQVIAGCVIPQVVPSSP